MTESHDIIFSHVARTLPDAPAERRTLLKALAFVLPTEHPAQTTVGALLSALQLQEQLQARLPLEFTQGRETR